MNFKKVQKRTARRLYNEGKKIYIVPCKVYPDFDNPWIKPFEMAKSKVENEYKGYPDLIKRYNFDSRINNFEFYNTCYELGYYSTFYIAE